ncbi:helix-turn-helix domain-containing protein [Chryseobacterium taklimakanense]|uniref:helix-turn-helix domain-containing protein n=1 Tax=Chryseobacterium taklimakanense TaxID=536441 RepID=UPI001E603C58|nr:helix-turn-helix transcriptional regulator [Chryseobacterium taklimakanense]
MLQVLVTKFSEIFAPFVKKVLMDANNQKILLKFGQHIKKIRLDKKLSQDDVVLNSFRITKGTISDIENGKRNLSFTTLIDLAKGLDLHPKVLMDFEIEKEK